MWSSLCFQMKKKYLFKMDMCLCPNGYILNFIMTTIWKSIMILRRIWLHMFRHRMAKNEIDWPKARPEVCGTNLNDIRRNCIQYYVKSIEQCTKTSDRKLNRLTILTFPDIRDEIQVYNSLMWRNKMFK